MTTAGASYGVSRPKGLCWRVVACVVLLAFAVQSYITQTHMHGTAQAFGGAAPVKIASNASGHNKAPIGNEASDCPFCQAVAHSGAFFAPAATFLVITGIWKWSIAPSVTAHASARAISHVWQSRAPPRR